MSQINTSELTRTPRHRRRCVAVAVATLALTVALAGCAAPTDVALESHLEHYGFDPGSLEISTGDGAVDVSAAVMPARQDELTATDRLARLVWEDHAGTFAEVRVTAGDRSATYTAAQLERRWGTRAAGLEQAEAGGLTTVQRLAAIGSGLAVLAIAGFLLARAWARPKITASSSALATHGEAAEEDLVLIEDSERLEAARRPKRTGLPVPSSLADPESGSESFDALDLVDQLAPDVVDEAHIAPRPDIVAPPWLPGDVLDVVAVVQEGCGYRPWLIGEWAHARGGNGSPRSSRVELVVKHGAFGESVAALRAVGFQATDDGSDNTLVDPQGRRVQIYLIKFDNAGYGWLTSSGGFGGARSFPPASFTAGLMAGESVLRILPAPDALAALAPAPAETPSPA